MIKTTEGSTGRLLQLCFGYFVSYVFTGLAVKYFMGKPELGFPGMTDMQYLVFSTLGGNLLCLAVVLALGWQKRGGIGRRELSYIIPSGVCTALVIPTTTLMYTLPISVMVAMVIMRGSIIVISRAVDAIQLRQGILRKEVYSEENWAVAFSILAVSVHLVFSRSGGFEFVHSTTAVAILSTYIVAYAIRIYIMNYYKNTRRPGAAQDNRGFFAIEQIAATGALALLTVVIFNSPAWFGWGDVLQVRMFREAIAAPHPAAGLAIASGAVFGISAFFSVFLFMFKGRTATFAGLANRLTSLIAGTASTVLFALSFGGKMPKFEDWLSLGFILIAVGFLSIAERKRAVAAGAARARTELAGAAGLTVSLDSAEAAAVAAKGG